MNIVRICRFAVMTIAVLMTVTACSKTSQIPPLAADATILAFGDSLTAGTGAGETESYPVVLSRLIGRKVVNAGVPGEISASGLQRLPEILERERPALLILCHGGNDLLARQGHKMIADNLRAMIRMARDQGITVLLVAVPSPDLSIKPPPFYEEVAKETGIPVELRVMQRILGKSSLKSDHVHPNAAGYRVMAEALANLLKKSGALPG